MKSPPKMPQRAMVRIWVASLHQKLQRREDAGVFLLSETFQSISKGGFEQQRSRLQRRRAPPAAEAARSCWGRGQRYASKAQRMLGAATRPPAAETGRRGWGSAPIFQGPAKGLQKNRQAQLVRPAACPQKTAAARKAPCGGCSHFVESSGKITLRTRQCTRSRTLPAAS